MQMNGCDIHESIREINVSYLALVQRMLREDRAGGVAELGLSASLAEVLVGLSQEQTLKLAARDQLICSFRFNGRAILGALVARAAELPAASRTMAGQAA
jgi:flagellar transcriptional activator FlhD